MCSKQAAAMSSTPPVPPPSRFHGLGAAFFPEHHPCETWDEYVALLRRSGLSFVRMGEFTWDKIEPREGRFDFAWLDDALDRLQAAGIRAILCTPTAVPPVWACEQYLDMLPRLEDGKTLGFGSRRYTCPTSPTYVRLCERVVTAMADHYRDREQILAWQLDNEFGDFCYCPRCERHFQAWCERRFGTIERMNDAVCSHFWGQTFNEFGQVALPTTYKHPGIWLLYHQFASDATVACFRRQAETLRSRGVRAPITTNMMITWPGYDHERMGEHLDAIAGDHYGLTDRNLFGDAFAHEAFVHAYLRGIRHGQNPWFHEFQCGRLGNTPLPGEVRWETLTQIGLGADLIDYFRFDTSPSGNERDGYGLIGVHRKPGRVFDEIRALAADVERLRPHLDGTRPEPARVGLLYTHLNHSEFARYPKSDSFAGPWLNGYSMHLARHFQSVTRLNLACDIVYPGAEFSAYDVILAPALYVLPAALTEKLERFVTGGGTLLVGSLSGVVDENGRLLDVPPPGPLAGACGIEVRDYGKAYRKAGPVSLVSAHPDLTFSPLPVTEWIDEILPASDAVDVLARYDNPFYPDVPALTRHRHGRGWAYYLGTLLDEPSTDALYRALLPAMGLAPEVELPAGVHLTARVKGDRRILFLGNSATEPQSVQLPCACEDLLTGHPLRDRIDLAPFEVRVLEPASPVPRNREAGSGSKSESEVS